MIANRRNWFPLVVRVAALLAMGVLGLFDMDSGLFHGTVSEITGPAEVLLSLATAAVWFPTHRHDSRVLPALAASLAVVSLLMTGFDAVENREAGGSWGLAEATGMTLVLVVLARRGVSAYAVPAAIGIGIALVAQPLRSGFDAEMVALGLLQALVGFGAAAAGAYLRYVADTRQRQLAVARAEQRVEFARDLHDFVAHHVTGIVVQAQGARFVAEQDPQRVMVALEQIEHAGAEAMTAMRRMVAMLRGRGTDAPLSPLAGIADLTPLVETFCAAGGPPVRLQVSGALDGLPVDVTTSAYRVVMEALTNVRQHATGATGVDVQVHRTPDWLLVRVADDGSPPHRAMTPRDRDGFGLVGLAERVDAVGGWLRAGPATDKGWLVDARLPVQPRGRR
jgi:signal transduction histidine kinase